MRRAVVAVALLAALAAGTSAYGANDATDAPPPIPVFEVPVHCDMRKTCFIQNYVDTEPGLGARDFTCGPLTYDGHDGTDIRIPGLQAMQDGIAVIAAAPGTVRAVRDGMVDVSISRTGEQAVAGREAGNSVVLDHAGGWETQYSHMRLGSISVRPGDTVQTGTKLGLVGLSGKTEFPHLHFAVRQNGVTLDPFTGKPPASGCELPGKSLWSAAAEKALAYRAGGPLASGFASEVIDLEAALSGTADAVVLSTTDPAIVFWVASWGLRQGDRETIRIFRPDGTVLTENETSVPGNKAQWLRYTGRKLLDTAWPAGRYRGEYQVARKVDGKDVIIVDVTRKIEVR
jgi:murein DD-endopeptidase MepM/ murein hydrolase activator NlpD